LGWEPDRFHREPAEPARFPPVLLTLPGTPTQGGGRALRPAGAPTQGHRRSLTGSRVTLDHAGPSPLRHGSMAEARITPDPAQKEAVDGGCAAYGPVAAPRAPPPCPDRAPRVPPPRVPPHFLTGEPPEPLELHRSGSPAAYPERRAWPMALGLLLCAAARAGRAAPTPPPCAISAPSVARAVFFLLSPPHEPAPSPLLTTTRAGLDIPAPPLQESDRVSSAAAA
jgi:hypothetical protein